MMKGRFFAFCAVSALIAGTVSAPAADRAGEATRSQQNAFQWAGLSPDLLDTGDEVYRQATVYTKDHGGLELTFDDASKLTLGPNTNLVIDDYVYSPDTNTGTSAIRLGRGALRLISGRIPSDNVRISTEVATVGIRGTDLILDTKNVPGTLRVWSKSGTVVVSPLGGDITYELVAPAFASCSSSSCELGPSPAEPSFFPISPPDPSTFGGEVDPGANEPDEFDDSQD